MAREERGLRLRALLDEYATLVVLALAVLALAGGFLTYDTYTGTDTRTEIEQTTTWESAGEFTYSATVVNGTDVYERGAVLTDRTAYFRTITPRLNGSFLYAYNASGGDLTANASAVLVLRSVEESDEGSATEYWRTESTLETRRVASLSPSETLRVPFSLNVNATGQRLEAIDEQFGGTPGQKEMFVEIRLQQEGTRGGQPVNTTRTYRLPISPSSSVYNVQDPGTVTDSANRSVQSTITVESGPLRAYGGPALLVLALVALAGFGAGRYEGYLAVSERERDWLAYRNDREEFDDWITAVRFTDGDRPGAAAEVDTLEGLVDIAIDTDRRVLEDADGGRFFVFADERTYAYDPPEGAVDEDESLPEDDATGVDSPFRSSDDADGDEPDGEGETDDEPGAAE